MNDPWGPPQNLGATINNSSDDQCPFVSPSGQMFIFASKRAGGQGVDDFYVSFRKNPLDDLAWEAPQILAELNSSSDEFGESLFISPAGAPVIFFTSDRPGGLGGNDIYTSTLQPNGKFSPPTLVRELSSSGNDGYPMVRPDGLEVFLTSNRTGGLGGNDLWVSTRATVSEPWSPPVNLGAPVNTSAVEVRGASYAGGTRLMFNSNRTGSASQDLYETTRTRTTAIPVLASLTGLSGTTFKSPGQLSNPYATPISGTVVFHPAGTQQSSTDLVLSYTLNPFETRTSGDVMASFGATGLGWLEIIPAAGGEPASSFRIEDSAGGATAVPTVNGSNVLVAGSSGVLTTPSDLNRFRLNIGIRTLPNGVAMTINVYDAATNLVRTVTRSFAPNSFAQFAAADLLGGPIAANETVVFRIDSGSAVIYGSSAANSGGGLSLQVLSRFGP